MIFVCYRIKEESFIIVLFCYAFHMRRDKRRIIAICEPVTNLSSHFFLSSLSLSLSHVCVYIYIYTQYIGHAVLLCFVNSRGDLRVVIAGRKAQITWSILYKKSLWTFCLLVYQQLLCKCDESGRLEVVRQINGNLIKSLLGFKEKFSWLLMSSSDDADIHICRLDLIFVSKCSVRCMGCNFPPEIMTARPTNRRTGGIIGKLHFHVIAIQTWMVSFKQAMEKFHSKTVRQ